MGQAFYPQINIRSNLKKNEIEETIKEALGKTILVTSKDEHIAYAGAKSEAEEGKTMGRVLPVLFLAIGILTMVTTMHRIASNEKIQIGTLKALGFRDRKILLHYTSYGFMIGLFGCLLGIGLGYGIAAIIISPNGMMSTYFDMPNWSLIMPAFCIPVIVMTVVLLTFISFLSVKKMLKGTAADALRPYEPKAMKKSISERFGIWERLTFGTRWNFRDVMRLLSKEISNYTTKVNLSEASQNSDNVELAKKLEGDWLASFGASLNGETVMMEVYYEENDRIRFPDENNKRMKLTDDGIYLCQRLKDKAKIGDIIEISPYGSEKTYKVRVAGYLRSVLSETIVMTHAYADSAGLEYHISSIYTDKAAREIESSSQIADKQEKQTIMDTYDSFMDIMNIMVLIATLADEYELKLSLGVLTYSVSLLVTFGVSLAVSFMVARKNKKIDMVEALKGTE